MLRNPPRKQEAGAATTAAAHVWQGATEAAATKGDKDAEAQSGQGERVGPKWVTHTDRYEDECKCIYKKAKRAKEGK